VVRQTEALSNKLLPQEAVFFLEVINDVLLALNDPAGKRCQQDMRGRSTVMLCVEK